MTSQAAEPTSGRTPPNNVAAERVVLGAMMLSTDVIADIIEIVKASDFYRPAHAAIFNAIIDLSSRDEPTDPIAVAQQLLAVGDLQRIGGVPYLHDCLETVPTAANGTWYARQVAETAGRRRLIETATKMLQLAAAPDLTLDEALDQAGAAFHDAITQRDSGELRPLADLVDPTIAEIRSVAAHRGELRGVSTGFHDLDQLTGGLRGSQLIIVAGRPGMGKSILGVDIARTVALRDGKPAAFFSLEMSEQELVTRILSAEARVPLNVFNSGHVDDNHWARLDQHAARLKAAPLHIDETPALTMTEIRARSRRLAQRHGLSLIVVDYLQLMTPSGRRTDSREQQVAEISRNMKLLAKELHVPVIAIAQLNRGPEQRNDKRPQLSDLRESGSLEQDADMVIFVHRDDYYDKDSPRAGEADFILAKHRGGPTDTVTVAAQLAFARFVDMAL
ncbi:replicative DNA helicase [Actinoplanes sp. NPDC051851]|uniref:replicative DNA helicase n=1 Tax=Actinoplanes sp. NPDC051851 TaxID=3154753 RepID=UPI003426FB95